jgi:tyrosine-protein kinase Etk/Wzc
MLSSDPGTQADSDPMPPPQSREDELSFLGLVIIIARRKRWIAGCTILFGVVAAIVSLLMPSIYTATTVILPPQNSSAGSALMSQINSMGPMAALAGSSMGMKNPNDMYISMFRSRVVEDAMIQRFDLKSEYRASRESDAQADFEKQSEVKSGVKDGLLYVSVSDRDPKRAAEMANGYVEEYRKFSGTLAITEASQRRLFFQQQLEQAKDNLANAEEALKNTEQTTGVIQMDSQARSLIDSAASLRAQIAAKEVEIQGMESFASQQNPDLLEAKQQLAGWQAQLARLTGNENDNGDDLLLSKGQVPGAGLEYARKLRDVKYYDTIFDLLAKQFEMAKLDEARQGSLVQVMDPAVPPDRRSSPKRLFITLLAMVAGLFVGLFWAFASEGLAIAERKPEDKAKIEELRRLLFAKSAR